MKESRRETRGETQEGVIGNWHLAIRNQESAIVVAGSAALGLLVRAWAATWLTDFWGDSYHHWLITRLTMDHRWLYSDYKGLEVVWTPLYHYLSALAIIASGRGDLAPLHAMNILLGAGACAAAAWLAMRLCANRLAGITAGAVLALMTWHVAFSAMNVTEVFAGLLVLAMALALVVEAPLALLLALGVAMPMTRTDLMVYVGVGALWLLIGRRLKPAAALFGGAAGALAGWSLWSWAKTGNALWWYFQYTQNNRYDWLLSVDLAQSPWLTFAAYLERQSPFVFPALAAGVLAALICKGVARRAIWLVTVLLAAHSLFLIIGYARGIVPILTERYLALDLPLIAVLMSAWVIVVEQSAVVRWLSRTVGRAVTVSSLLASILLIASTGLRFYDDIPELVIRRWGIDPEWQIGSFLDARMQPGDTVLTDAPVAIYRSGKPLGQFISSVELARVGDPARALAARRVSWIVTQPVSYDGAAAFIPRRLMIRQQSGRAGGLRYELVWRYDPSQHNIQSEVWHVSNVSVKSVAPRGMHRNAASGSQ